MKIKMVSEQVAPKFVQITASADGVAGLDADGRVWVFVLQDTTKINAPTGWLRLNNGVVKLEG